MAAELSREARRELDELDVSEVLTVVMGYVADRHRLLAVGEAKLVVIFVDARPRKAYLELGMSLPTLDLLAA